VRRLEHPRVWYIAIYGISALVLMAFADWRLAVPTGSLGRGLRALPRLFRAAHARPGESIVEVRSHVMGPVVDSYTNILTVKLFARAPRRGRRTCAR
jgi:ATP-binding cassette subfamily B multidrug efflux pump